MQSIEYLATHIDKRIEALADYVGGLIKRKDSGNSGSNILAQRILLNKILVRYQQKQKS